jgi:probable rRNA maturation factor
MGSLYLPPWRIDVVRRPGVYSPVPLTALARLCARSLDSAGAPAPASLGLILSDDGELAVLNADHMGHDGPTDVLSFPMLPASDFPAHEGQDPDIRNGADSKFRLPPRRRPHLGDIVVSVERAAAQAPEQGWAADDELRQLVVHGVLHICGWDHARAPERDAMRRVERDLLARS